MYPVTFKAWKILETYRKDEFAKTLKPDGKVKSFKFKEHARTNLVS